MAKYIAIIYKHKKAYPKIDSLMCFITNLNTDMGFYHTIHTLLLFGCLCM